MALCTEKFGRNTLSAHSLHKEVQAYKLYETVLLQPQAEADTGPSTYNTIKLLLVQLEGALY